MVKIQSKQIDAASASGSIVTEVLNVTDTTGTLSQITGSYTGRLFMLFVNGVCYIPVVKNPPFTVNGQVLTWSTLNAGFPLEMSDSVVAIYSSSTQIGSTGTSVKTTASS